MVLSGQKRCWSGTRGELQTPCPGPGEPDHGQDSSFNAGFDHDFELDEDWITAHKVATLE